MFFKGRCVKGKKSGIWVIYIEDGTFNLLLSGKYRNGKAVSKKQHLSPPPSIAVTRGKVVYESKKFNIDKSKLRASVGV